MRFKIPRALLLESPVFRQMFELPVADKTIADGSDDEHPLKLEGVKVEEFEFFVRAAMIRYVHSMIVAHMQQMKDHLRYVESLPASTTLQQSHAVLRLCDMWSFEELKADTITHLNALFSTDEQYAVWKFRIGKDHDIPDWIGPAVRTLVTRSATLSQEDIEILTPMIAAKIIALREGNIWHCYVQGGKPTGSLVEGWPALHAEGGISSF
jgi:hypothetical protein